MKEKYYKYTKELQYKNIKTMILCEEYLEDNSGGLIEYSLHCFNGKVEFVEVHTDRFNVYKENYYYLIGQKLSLEESQKIVPSV